jgi:superfamily I DNA and/or RNA helicase
VRSKADTTGSDALRGLGFLTNPKRFNVALTRAQALLIVVGNATLLSIDENWKIFIDFVIKNEGYRGVSMTGFSIDR